MTKVNFAPDVDIIELPATDYQREDPRKDYEKMESLRGHLSIMKDEQEDPLNLFLEPEHKVELEFGRNGSLVISPSTAKRLYALGHHSASSSHSNSKESLSNSKERKGWRRYGGLLLAFSASFFFSLSVVMVKILGDYHPLSISVWRYLGILVPSIPIVFFVQCQQPCRSSPKSGSPGNANKSDDVNIFQTVFPLREREKINNFVGLMMRGLLGCTSVLLRFYSLKYLTVADSSVISYSGPVFVVILAHFVLGEKCGVVSIFVAILTSFGVFVIVRPPILTGGVPFDVDTLIGAALAFASMVCNSTVVILMRKIRQVHYALMLLTFGAWGVAESLVVALAFGVLEAPHGAWDSFLTLGVLPTIVFCGQISIILAVKFENAGPVSLIRTCDVIFSFIWQFLFLSVSPDIYSLVGAVVVICGVILTGLRKWISTLPSESRIRRRFKVLLK